MSRSQTAPAKALVARTLSEQGIAYEKLSARTVSFQDLARDSAVFVKIHGLTLPEPRLIKVRETLRHDEAGRKVCIEPVGALA